VLLPLYVARERPLRLLRFVGAGPADELGPICAQDDGQLAAALLEEKVAALLDGHGLFLAERLGGKNPAGWALSGIRLRHNATPVIRLAGCSFDDYLASRSRNFRSQLRRAERRLAREHRLSYRVTQDPDDLERDLTTLMRLHRMRWQKGSKTFTGPREAFQRDFARRAFDQGWLRLWTMELDGQPVACWYGLRYGGADYYYQAGRDPRLGPLKVGFVLLGHTIRSACEDGMQEYRFGLGDEPYKSRFTELDPGLNTFAVPFGAGGRLALRSLQVGLRARDRVRRVNALRGR
jgi:CelD/BcsL family acetyltransferase involved in cellulose biosynthesis